MTGDDACAALAERGEASKAKQMAAYHKAPRRYLGVSNPEIDALVRQWRAGLDVSGWVALADALWKTDVHEARIAAAKLVTRNSIRPDDAVWSLVCRWVETFDAWAIADHATGAGQKRLLARADRMETVATWTTHENMWVRRAALVITLPYARLRAPDPTQADLRRRVLGWAETYVPEREWFIQKAIAWWLRELSKVDPAATSAFLTAHGAEMKPFARREAGKYLARS